MCVREGGGSCLSLGPVEGLRGGQLPVPWTCEGRCGKGSCLSFQFLNSMWVWRGRRGVHLLPWSREFVTVVNGGCWTRAGL